MALVAIPNSSPTKTYSIRIFSQKSKSTEELSREVALPDTASSLANVSESECSDPRSSTGSESTGSLCGLSLVGRSGEAVEQLKTSRKQLEDEIEVLYS